jgi:phenylacetate-CoA ligase
VDRIRHFKPRCIFGYPSSLSLLCELAKKANIDLSALGIKVIFSTAEVLYTHQRKIISETFGGIPVVDGYGSREGGFISHECPDGCMHITSESVIVEFIKDGCPVKAGEEGEIVITHLDNYAMPFIRYKTGDIGRPSNKQCKCGRGLETMEICLGRSTDFILTEDGRVMHGLALIYIVRDIPGVQKYKIIQEKINQIRILIVHDDNFPKGINKHIIDQVKNRMGKITEVMIELVDDIPVERSGKYRYVESKVDAF